MMMAEIKIKEKIPKELMKSKYSKEV